jgi:hypothetical protein
MVCIDFGDFSNNPLSFGSNSLCRETHFFSVIDIPGATGLEKGQGQGARLGNFKANKLR